MRILRTVPLALLCVCVFSGVAFAEQHAGFYLGGYAGLQKISSVEVKDNLGSYNLKPDNTLLYGFSLGYDLPDDNPLGTGRIELVYQQTSVDIPDAEFSDGTFPATGQLKLRSLLLNSFATFPNRTRFTPYAGLGLGATQVELSQLATGNVRLDDKDLVLSGQGGLGLTMDITKHLRLDLGYRFMLTRAAKLRMPDSHSARVELTTHTVQLGIVWLF